MSDLRCIVCDRRLDDQRALFVFFRGGRRLLCSHACRLSFKRAPESYVPVADPAPLPPEPARPRSKPFLVRTVPALPVPSVISPEFSVDRPVEIVDTNEVDD